MRLLSPREPESAANRCRLVLKVQLGNALAAKLLLGTHLKRRSARRERLGTSCKAIFRNKDAARADWQNASIPARWGATIPAPVAWGLGTRAGAINPCDRKNNLFVWHGGRWEK